MSNSMVRYVNFKKDKFEGQTNKLVTKAFVEKVRSHLSLDYPDIPEHGSTTLTVMQYSSLEICRHYPRLGESLKTAMKPDSVAQTWLESYLRDNPAPPGTQVPKIWGDAANAAGPNNIRDETDLDLIRPRDPWFDNLLDALMTRFTPPNVDAEINTKLRNLKQGTGSYRTFIDKFDKLHEQLTVALDEQTRRYILWHGAKDTIRSALIGVLEWTDTPASDLNQRLLSVDE